MSAPTQSRAIHSAFRIPRPAGWVLLTVAAVLVGLRLFLTLDQPVRAIGFAGHDDRLFLVLADHLRHGDWLGPYDRLTLAKGPFYPLWIAFTSSLGVALPAAQQVLYVVACVALVAALRPWLRRDGLAVVLLGVLLCNPILFETEVHARVIRQGVYASLALLALAGLAGLAAAPAARPRTQWAWAALAAGAGAAFWLTREEGVWLAPLAGLLALAAVAARWRARAPRGAWWPLACVPVAFAVPLLVVAEQNRRHYGVFTTCEFRTAAFKDAYGALCRPLPSEPKPFVPVRREVREKLYRLSPAFAELEPHLEGWVGETWAEPSGMLTGEPAAHREIAGGWFMWALRDAVSEAGHAKSGAASAAYYARLAREVNAACDERRIPAGPRRSGFVAPLDPGAPARIAGRAARAAWYFVSFEGFSARPQASSGSPESLELFARLTRARLAPVDDAGLAAEAARRAGRIAGLEAVLAALRTAGPAAGLAAAVAYLVSGFLLLRRRRLTPLLVLNTGLAAATAALLLLNALVDATAFPTVTTGQYSPAYALWLAFLVTAWLQAAEALSRGPDPAGPGTA